MVTDKRECERLKDLDELRTELNAVRIRLEYVEKAKEKLETKVYKIETEVMSYILRFSIGTIVVLVSTVGFLVKQFILK